VSHFAEINENNVVLRVLVGDNDMPNEGYDWFIENLGGTWIKTSYNGSIRKNFAGIGYTYNEELDAFIPPKPHESWSLNSSTCLWQAPVAYPQDGRAYVWNEESLLWVELETSSKL
jgi:hypothetical protein